MNKTDILQFINDNPACTLATVEDNRPRVRGTLMYRADENHTPIAIPAWVWTGTGAYGHDAPDGADTTYSCGYDWNDSTATFQGISGRVGSTDSLWTGVESNLTYSWNLPIPLQAGLSKRAAPSSASSNDRRLRVFAIIEIQPDPWSTPEHGV